MTAAATWFGVIGMAIFLPLIYRSLQVKDAVAAVEDLSMYTIFESGRGETAFDVLVATFVFYALTLIVSGYGALAGITLRVELGLPPAEAPVTLGLVAGLDRFGALVAFLGLAYFMHIAATITRAAAEDHQEELKDA